MSENLLYSCLATPALFTSIMKRAGVTVVDFFFYYFQECKTPPTFCPFSYCKFRSVGKSALLTNLICYSKDCPCSRVWSMHSLCLLIALREAYFHMWEAFWSFSWGLVIVCNCHSWSALPHTHPIHSMVSVLVHSIFLFTLKIKLAVFSQRLSYTSLYKCVPRLTRRWQYAISEYWPSTFEISDETFISTLAYILAIWH